MQTRRNLLRLAAVGSWLAVFVSATPGFAVDIIDDPAQIDERAAQVVQNSNSLCWEMYRYHQQKPDYAPQYRSAKELWARAGDLREALRNGPVETEVLVQQVTQMNDVLSQVEKGLSKWGDGDRSSVPANGGPGTRTYVTQGVGVDVPFVGIRVGGPRVVVTEDGPPALERRRLHPNSRGSRRSLERELAALRTAVNYLLEDTGITDKDAPRAPAAGPVPNPPPDGQPGLGEPVKVAPPSAKIPGAGPSRK